MIRNATSPVPPRAFSIQCRIVSVMWPLFMITVMPRAMPIVAPLAGFLGVSTALVVTSYQSASGVMNLFVPTSAVVMGGLAIARVPYGTYLRWVWPLLVLLSALSIAVLAISAAI